MMYSIINVLAIPVGIIRTKQVKNSPTVNHLDVVSKLTKVVVVDAGRGSSYL